MTKAEPARHDPSPRKHHGPAQRSAPAEGGLGNDQLLGGQGSDTLSFASSLFGVTINLGNGMAQGGHAAGDSFSPCENVTGSDHADALFGDGLANLLKGGKGADTIFGGANDDTIEGGLGGDILDGGIGSNTLSYAGLANGVVMSFMQIGADTHIVFAGQNEMILQNVNAGNLQASDFLFV